jgi:uncharacterized delta-60 repeat protein
MLPSDPGDGVPVKDPVNPSFISSLGVLPSGKLVVGGNFPSFNGIRRFNIAQLNADGSLDTSFNPGIGADGTVWAISPLPNGQIVIAGEFTAVNGFSRPHIARLNSDGSVDLSFDPGTNGPNGTIYALAQGLNASIYIGGDFNSVNGLARRSVAQLSTNGVVMTDFSPITGPDGPVFTLAVQPDRRLLVGGSFANVEFAPAQQYCALQPEWVPGLLLPGGVRGR